MNRLGALAGVPFLNGSVELQARIAADVGALSDFVEERRRIFLLQRFATRDGACPPFLAVHRSLHEFVADANGKVLVLIHDAAVSLAVKRAVVALLHESPGLLLFLLFAVDEFLDVAVPVAKRVHFGSAAGFSARLHDIGDLVVNFEETQWPAWAAAAAQFFFAGADGAQIGAGAGAVLEEHRFAVGEAHDVFHVVVHRLNKAGAALGILVLCRSALRFALLRIVKPIALGGSFAHAVLMKETHVEPDGRVKGAVLIDAKPGELVIKHFTVRFAEVTVLHTPIGNRAADAMDELANGGLPLRSVLFTVKIFGDDDLGGEHRPGFGDFDVFLLKNDLARVVSDLGGAFIPFQLIKGAGFSAAKNPFEFQRFVGAGSAFGNAAGSARRYAAPTAGSGGGQKFISGINHDKPFCNSLTNQRLKQGTHCLEEQNSGK